MSEIHIECYLSVLNKYRAQFPDARFEIIVRRARNISNFTPSPLSPSNRLLADIKAGRIGWEEYIPRFIAEIEESAEAQALLDELAAEDRDVFLVCYEDLRRPNAHCHRQLVKKMIEDRRARSIA